MSSSSPGSATAHELAALFSNSCSSSRSLPRNTICRRIRSIALLRPTWPSQARGLDGGSDAGQRSSATEKASCRASSARSKSPTRRISVANVRPASSRNIFSISASVMRKGSPSIIHPDRPDLDRTKAGAGNTRGDRKRGIEILGFDQVVPAELLAGFRERTIGGQGFAVTHPHGRCRRGRLQPVAAFEIAALDNGLGEGAVFLQHLLVRRLVDFAVLGFVSVDHQQILHLVAPFDRRDRRHQSNGQSQNDIFRIIYFNRQRRRYRLDAMLPSPHHKGVSRPDGRSGNHRKVAGEESPGSIDIRCRITSGGGNPRDSATENEPPAFARSGSGG